MINSSSYKAQIKVIYEHHKADLHTAKSVGGNCSICKRSVVDTAQELRCRFKNLKLVKSYNVCNYFKEQDERKTSDK